MGYVLDFREIDQTQVAGVGGKGALLGELSRIEGIRVPGGFCVTTDAFERILAAAPAIDDRLARLSRLEPEDGEAIHALSAETRRIVEGIAIPDDVTSAITRALARLGKQAACAVRSSATAEDLPSASFAGQYDSFLNVVGPRAVLQHVSRCWASLFSERAVTYRLRNGFEHRKVQMAVVVQQMSFPQAAGILFTADPVTSSRKVASVEASFGLAEALVSGLVNADTFKVRDGEVVARAIATKQRTIHASPMSGTEEVAVAPERQEQPALSDAQVVRLVQTGRRIEAHFGHPQDIEWCLVEGDFWIVQSRPITTLFPIPAATDRENRVYVSVGHQQMMTDPMKPLGLSVWQLTTARPMAVAGGRLFVDVTPLLASPTSRVAILKGLGGSDPLIGDALQTVLDRGFVRSLPDEALGDAPGGRVLRAMEIDPADRPVEPDQLLVAELIERSEASIAALRDDIRAKSGSELLDFIARDIDEELQGNLFDPRSLEMITATMNASRRLNEDLSVWLGERNAADVLTQSVPGNVTSEMGLALMDVADVIRPHADVVAFLEHVDDDGFLDDMAGLAGGRAARAAIEAYLERYGMRCAGEIDITRLRWSEHPSALVPMILANVKNFEPDAGRRRFEAGRQEAGEKEKEVLSRVRALPHGEEKAVVAKRLIDRVRILSGYREYPKYGMVSRYAIYKQALLEEAGRLVQARVLREREDIFYLWFDELKEVVRTRRLDERLIGERRDAFRSYQALTPPRVLTSDGEVIAGAYRREDVRTGALIGLPVSAGTIEGRARVIRDIAQADIEAGEILVTTYTDPSWTPLFLAIKGLVTEVGGLMTHGAVIAREYGLPAVVGVEHATNLIRDGQRIRVHGTEGYVEILL